MIFEVFVTLGSLSALSYLRVLGKLRMDLIDISLSSVIGLF